VKAEARGKRAIWLTEHNSNNDEMRRSYREVRPA
jgi:hypothetical protein